MYSNIQKVFYRSGIADIQFLPECWMVAQGILREDELRGKTLLVDLEDSHAGILLVHRFAPVYNKIAPYGADRALSGLAEDFKLDFSELRNLKERFGSLDEQSGFGGGRIPLPADKTGGVKTIEAEDFQKRIYDSSVTLLKKLGSEIA